MFEYMRMSIILWLQGARGDYGPAGPQGDKVRDK